MTMIAKVAVGLLAFFASSVSAAPVQWTVPPTAIWGAVASGTFTYDQTTSTLSEINITVTRDPPVTFIYPCNTIFLAVADEYACGQADAVATIGTLVFLIPVTGLPNPTSRLRVGDCLAIDNGICTGIDLMSGSDPVILEGTPGSSAPQAIPTLSEWAMILMASLMALFGIRRKRRQ